jgi:hypothetical protein
MKIGFACTMSPMRLPLRSTVLLALALSIATIGTPARAEKLNGFYSGSGGIAQEVHRVLIIEFAADGTAILQQKWHDKDPQTWHAHWKQDKKTVTITYDPSRDSGDSKDSQLPAPLVFSLKHGTLTATSWDSTTLGPLGPPKLTTFGGNVPQVTSVASCQALNSIDPTQNCITWDSRR